MFAIRSKISRRIFLMKLRNVIAAASAVVVAAASTITSFAASPFKGSINSAGMFACLLSDDVNVPMFTSYDQISDLCGFTLNIKAVDKRAIESAVAEGAWISGDMGFNSQSTGWKQYGWGIEGSSANDKPYQFKAGDKRGEYSVTYMQDTPIFASTDTYAQIWLQNYSDAYEFEIVDFTLLNSKGEDITKAAETTAPAETTAAPEETTAPAEETVEVSIDTAEVETFEVETAEVETAEVDTAEVAITEAATAEAATAEAATAEAATAEAPADNAADANKGNPETGVAGVAVAAGVVALAGAAVVASRKRK